MAEDLNRPARSPSDDPWDDIEEAQRDDERERRERAEKRAFALVLVVVTLAGLAAFVWRYMTGAPRWIIVVAALFGGVMAFQEIANVASVAARAYPRRAKP